MLNKVMLIGRLGKDPELRYTPSGQAVCDFTVATNETFNDREGQRQERTEWHRIVVWGKQGENCKRYLAKGRRVFVEGRLQTREWEDKTGGKRYTTEIVAQNVRFLDTRDAGGQGGSEEPPPPNDEYAPTYSSGGSPRRSSQGGAEGESWSRGGSSGGSSAPAGADEMPPLDEDLPF